MATADWDEVTYIRKKQPKASQLRSQQVSHPYCWQCSVINKVLIFHMVVTWLIAKKSVLIFFILHHKFHFKQICMKMKKNNLIGLGFFYCVYDFKKIQDLGHLVYSSVTQSAANLEVSVKSRIWKGHVKY